LPLMTTPEEFIAVLKDWLSDSRQGVVAEPAGLANDELPDEGVPVSEEFIEDDEPVYAGE